MEKRYQWKLKQREIVLGERTLLMGGNTGIPTVHLRARLNLKTRAPTSSISAQNPPGRAPNESLRQKNCAV